MELSPDYEDLFKQLNAAKIKYLVVGAHAVMHYTEPRFTKDIDIWIPPQLNDVKNIYKALKEFRAPLHNINPEDFKDEKLIFQIGVAPVRIDILFGVPGITAQTAWSNRKKSRYGRTSINILGLKELIKAKKAIARPQDKLDIQRLLKKKMKFKPIWRGG